MNFTMPPLPTRVNFTEENTKDLDRVVCLTVTTTKRLPTSYPNDMVGSPLDWTVL